MPVILVVEDDPIIQTLIEEALGEGGFEVDVASTGEDACHPPVSRQEDGDWASRGVPNSIMLSKPFAPARLVTAVSQLLNSGSSAT